MTKASGPAHGRPVAKRSKRVHNAPPRARPRALAPTPGGGERLELAMRAINEGVYDWDVATGKIHYSEGVYAVLHLPRSVKTPMDWRQRIHPDDLAAFDAALVAHFKNKTERFECDYRYRARGGAWRWARQHGIAQRDAHGRVVRMIGSTGDITELKRVAQALKESQERLSLATQAATEGIYDWNVETGSLYLSDRTKAFFAISGRKLTPAAWNAHVHLEDLAGYRAAIASVFRSRRSEFEYEYRVHMAKGRVSWLLDRAVVVRGAEGRVTRLVGAVADITQRKLDEIELRRARDEATEALERQTATAEVLASISGSMADTQPVFDRIVQNVRRLFGTRFAVLQLLRGDMVEMPAVDGHGIEKLREHYPRPLDTTTIGGLVMITKQAVQYAPVLNNPVTPPATAQFARDIGFNSVIFMPMFHEGRVIGAIGAAHPEPRPFDERQIALLKTFAEQAAIAIQNVRLFKELEARNRDVTDALEQQTATAQVLQVISRSTFDLAPVFDALVENATRLCGAQTGMIFGREGDMMRLDAAHCSSREFVEYVQRNGVALDRGSVTGRTAIEGRTIHVLDVTDDPEYRYGGQSIENYRTIVGVPLLRDGQPIGVFTLWRHHVEAFTPRQIALVETFADQAVIAIENVRLFNETKEALERQTATAEILKVISSSPTDTKPIFDAIVQSAVRLCDAVYSAALRLDGDLIHLVAHHNWKGEGLAVAQRLFPMPLDQDHLTARAIRESRIIHLQHMQSDLTAPATSRELALATGYQTLLIVPMLREGRAIGAIVVANAEGPFSEKQIALLQTFADQAVIAIENARLFNETKESLERQTATSEILRVISSSPTDIQPVLDTVAESAARLCGSSDVEIFRRDGDRLRLVAHHGLIPSGPLGEFTLPLIRGSINGRAMLGGQTVHVADLQTEANEFPVGSEFARQQGSRTQLSVPMLREGVAIGTISLRRTAVELFTERQVALLKTFADQAVIAIENVRLFNELQSRTEALTRSVGQLTALGEVGQAISSTLDLATVLQTIVSRAVQLTGLNGGSIYEFEERSGEFHLRAAEGMPDKLVEMYRKMPIRLGEGIVGRAAATREPVQVADIQDQSYQTRYRELLIRQGYRAILAVPLLRDEQIIGALTVSRNEPGVFAPEVVELLKTFATQSAMAIQNARLFREIEAKGKQLELASRHKSDFLASMSHELRTPLNAILGFNELILGEIYGEVPKDMREPLEDIQKSGKHLLRLINNVLDLAKIEAGRMELALSDYAVQDVVENVRSTLRPLATEKGLEFLASAPNELPLAYGDAGRITQCLMNLAGNSLKFTKVGKVEISVAEKDGLLTFRVADTGIGIPSEKIGSLFTEFKQTDATIASEYGGTGLGLSISRQFIEMHGGRIWVESEPGKGSVFIFEVPLRAAA